MSTKFDNRAALAKVMEHLDEPATQQMLAFASGYEAGKLSNLPLSAEEGMKEQKGWIKL